MSDFDFEIRHIEPDDMPRMIEIYNHYIETTHSTLYTKTFSLAQGEEWLNKFSRTGAHQCFVAVRDGKPFGYISSSQFRAKQAYDTSVEASMYLDPERTGRGVGTRMYEHLLTALSDTEVHRLYGGTCLPNEKAVRMVLSLGFQHVATFHEVGYKFGKYWDVAWYECKLPWRRP